MTAFYTQDGVNISAGDAFSAFVGDLCRQSYRNSPFVRVSDLSRGNFRGPRGWKFVGLPEGCFFTSAVDGIGTKVVVIDAAESYENAAHDVIAMTAMDITRYGGFPLVFTNIFDVSSLGQVGSRTFENCQAIMRGLGELAKRHGYILLTGETAELGFCVGSENPDASVKFNWGGCMTGVYHPDKMILGDTLAHGQVVIAFQDGFRSNGMSSVRKAFAMRHGAKWWNKPDAQSDIKSAAVPSVQYDRLFNRLHGWFNPSLEPLVKLHLIVHLSGGAFKGKLAGILKSQGLSAELDNLFDPPPIMRECAVWRAVSSEECYEVWNGGQGAIAVVDAEAVGIVMHHARQEGISAQVAGKITANQGFSVAITSKFDGTRVLYS